MVVRHCIIMLLSYTHFIIKIIDYIVYLMMVYDGKTTRELFLNLRRV